MITKKSRIILPLVLILIAIAILISLANVKAQESCTQSISCWNHYSCDSTSEFLVMNIDIDNANVLVYYNDPWDIFTWYLGYSFSANKGEIIVG